MATSSPAVHHSPYAAFDRVIERRLGADMRLLYGMGVPVVGLGVLVAVLLGFAASPWIVAGLMVLEVALIGVFMVGFVGLLNENDERS